MKPHTKDLIAMLPEIAREYDETVMNMRFAATRESYAAFVAETWQQFNALVRDGWKFSPQNIEYCVSASMFADMARKRLNVYIGGQRFVRDNPMARYAGGWMANEAFRAVHDVNGHLPGRAPFETLEGEIEAYLTHKAMYSTEALPALFGETIGQLAYHHAHGVFVPVQDAKIITVRF